MLGRPGKAEDVEGIIVFLAIDDAASATGGIFTVDGFRQLRAHCTLKPDSTSRPH